MLAISKCVCYFLAFNAAQHYNPAPGVPKMKNCLIALLALVAQSSFADTISLSPGDSVSLGDYSITCQNGGNSGGANIGSADCNGAGRAFSKTLAACAELHNGGTCADIYWPKFKANYPNCIYAGQSFCIDYCSELHNGGICAEKCQ